MGLTRQFFGAHSTIYPHSDHWKLVMLAVRQIQIISTSSEHCAHSPTYPHSADSKRVKLAVRQKQIISINILSSLCPLTILPIFYPPINCHYMAQSDNFNSFPTSYQKSSFMEPVDKLWGWVLYGQTVGKRWDIYWFHTQMLPTYSLSCISLVAPIVAIWMAAVPECTHVARHHR